MSLPVAPRRHRILHLLPDLSRRGEQLVVRQYLAHRDETAFDTGVAFCSAPTDLLDDFAATGVRLHPLHRPGHERLRLLGDLVRLIRNDRIDLLHLHGPDDVPGCLAAALTGVPVVGHLRWTEPSTSDDPGEPGAQPRRARARRRAGGRSRLEQRTVAAYLVDSPALATRWRGRVGAPVFTVRRGVPHPSGYEADPLRPPTAPLATGSGPLVVSVDRLADDVEPERLVALLPGILRAHPTARLVLTGDAVRQSRCADRARRLGVGDALVLFGPDVDEDALLARADVCVAASPPGSSGHTVLRALAAGVPTVTSRITALDGVVQDGVNAVVVPSGDHEGLITAVADLLDRPAHAARLGDQARRLVSERCPPERTARSYEQVYRHVLRPEVPAAAPDTPAPTPVAPDPLVATRSLLKG